MTSTEAALATIAWLFIVTAFVCVADLRKGKS